MVFRHTACLLALALLAACTTTGQPNRTSSAGPATVTEHTVSSASAAWLVGTWKGVHKATFTRSDDATFTFHNDGRRLVWDMKRIWDSPYGGRQEAEARGVVVNVSDSTVNLHGTYTKATNVSAVGVGITYGLNKMSDTVLEGHLAGAQGNFPVTLTKTK